MADKYLDDVGVETLVQMLKDYIDDQVLNAPVVLSTTNDEMMEDTNDNLLQVEEEVSE